MYVFQDIIEIYLTLIDFLDTVRLCSMIDFQISKVYKREVVHEAEP